MKTSTGFFSDGSERITQGKHLEKLCLIRQGVGRDKISDFTTTLIKEYLLNYTQEFARQYMKPEQCRMFAVRKVKFNYVTESWETLPFYLPYYDNDFVLLVPRDLLTRDDTWINRTDLIETYSQLPAAISDEGLRAQVNNYFLKMLPDNPKEKDQKAAAAKTIAQFPELIDYYIKIKEERGDEAVASSDEKVAYAESLFLENFTRLAALVATQSDFYAQDAETIEGALARTHCVKSIVEDHGGYELPYNLNGNPVSLEDELRIAYRFLWFSPLANNAPTRKEYVPVEFKLASNNRLKSYLNKKIDKIQEVSDGNTVEPCVIVIFCFSDLERSRVEDLVHGLILSAIHVIMIDASKSTQQRKELAMYQTGAPSVFVSYSHDCDVWKQRGQDPLIHKNRVRKLVENLRREGVPCIFDQHIESPPDGWPRWMMNQIEDATYVLVVATETYNRRFRGKEEPGKGKGSQWEGAVITQELYDTRGKNDKFIPVIFDRSDEVFIPLPLRGATYYDASISQGYDDLYYRLTNQPGCTPNALGQIRKRPQ